MAATYAAQWRQLCFWIGGKRSEFSESVVRSILLEDLTWTITLKLPSGCLFRQGRKFVFASMLRQRFTPRQLSEDNRPIVLPLFLLLLHAKDIWRTIHVFQRDSCPHPKPPHNFRHWCNNRYGESVYRAKVQYLANTLAPKGMNRTTG